MILVRSVIFNIIFYLALVALSLTGLPCLLQDRLAAQNLGRRWGRVSRWLLEKICRTKVEFRGLDHIPQGACIIASKHQSLLETMMLPLHSKDFSYILKRELMFLPFFGWYLRKAGQIGINRAKGSAALTDLTRQASKVLAEGRQIFIFPEGTRRPPGAAPNYKAGVAFLYAASNVPCVPVAVNTGLFWPRRRFLRRPGTVVIEYLEPIEPGLEKRAFMQLLETRIETATNRLMEEAMRNDPTVRQGLVSNAPDVPQEPVSKLAG
ncbi:lysophospholipid acyltransferase family protein [Beijerinckia indica]|uniref:Phospholipid/glycerol acyltransferase n=1 Tax=Beijerinckia indica subsp. indica (strain ATCC 9039 / DSM 1715 / NCIMB 8712) TaxID=395963 RepID=B2IG45_BEII9|nr:lysophospholipid acyltransferase family protein [Beijerinckia indica]ACB97119.1 phospholipid/glycerol acyltransferase [Beijerinckia indica subsp. indica ATCC 9039]